MSDKYWFLMGGGTWEGSSEGAASGILPIQGVLSRATNVRRGKLSYNEFFMGWRYNAIRRPEKRNLYYRISLHEIFDIDYREDWAFLFQDGPVQSFRKNMVIQSQGTGVLLLQVGVGAEFFLRQWLSVGLESGYAFGIRKFTLRDSSLRTDFLPTDNLFVDVPIRPNPATQNIEYNAEDGSGYKDMKLSFNGWKALFRVNIYY